MLRPSCLTRAAARLSCHPLPAAQRAQSRNVARIRRSARIRAVLRVVAHRCAWERDGKRCGVGSHRERCEPQHLALTRAARSTAYTRVPWPVASGNAAKRRRVYLSSGCVGCASTMPPQQPQQQGQRRVPKDQPHAPAGRRSGRRLRVCLHPPPPSALRSNRGALKTSSGTQPACR